MTVLPNQPVGFNSTLLTPKVGKRQLIFLLGFVSLTLLTFLFLIGLPIERPVAVVNGDRISKADFDRRVEVQRFFYTSVSPNENKLATLEKDELEFLIQLKLLEQFARKHGRIVTDQDVASAIEESYKKAGLTKKQYEQKLARQYKQTIEDVKLNFKEELLIKRIVGTKPENHLFAIWFPRNKPLEETDDITENWGVIEDKFPEGEKPVYELAKSVFERVEKGEDFSKLAREYSKHEQTAKKGGDLGKIGGDYNPYQPIVSGQTSPIAQRGETFPAPALVIYAYQYLEGGQVALYNYPLGFGIFKSASVAGGEKPLIKVEDLKEGVAKLREEVKVEIFN